MSIFKVILFGSFLSLSFLGCQGNNSDVNSSVSTVTSSNTTSAIPSVTSSNTTSTIPSVTSSNTTSVTSNLTVILPVSATVLTTNNEIVNISVKVFDSANNPYSGGKIIKINPNDVLTGRDIGTFDTIEANLTNGVAAFHYTAPDNLVKDKSTLTFGFYHDSNPSKVMQYTMSIVPEVNQIILTNYSLQAANPKNVTVGLESSKLVSYGVYDTNNKQINNSAVKSITISSLNPSLGTLKDTVGNSGTKITVKGKNNVTVKVVTNTKSGVVPIKVDATFTDANSKEQNLTKVFNVVVLSGPPTAMSLSYASTDATGKKDYAKMVEKWVLTVTDKYNNLVNTNPAISMGMLAGYAQSSAPVGNVANYLYYLPSVGNGTMDGVANTFSAPASAFSNVDQANDYLVTFGNGYTYNASGKWDISRSSAKVLNLIDDFNGTTVSGLGYAVGHNFRQDACREAQEWVGNVYPESGSYILDGNGSMRLNVEYDYYLVDKDVVLWTNLTGKQNSENQTVRLGEAKKINLRGSGITAESYSFSKGFKGVVRLKLLINGSGEYLRNSRFSYSVLVASDGANWTVTDDSMKHNITYCNPIYKQNGMSYVDVNFTTQTPSAGTVTLTNVLPVNEF